MASSGLVHSVFHGEYVALSFGLAFVGAYVGIHLCEQFRLGSRENQSKLLSRQMLLVLMACSIGGVAIWSMHFVGMAAVSFQDGIHTYTYLFLLFSHIFYIPSIHSNTSTVGHSITTLSLYQVMAMTYHYVIATI